MAFPVVESTAATTFGGGALSHLLTMPSGIVPGDLLVFAIANDMLPVRSWPARWTPLALLNHASGAVSMEVRYRIADGTEGPVMQITLDLVEQLFALGWRISGADLSTPPLVVTAEGTSSTADAPSQSAAWGIDDNLWLCGYGSDPATGFDFSGTGPTDYTVFSTGGANDFAAGAHRQLVAASEDPGTFVMNASQEWITFTAAIKPAVPGSFAPRTRPMFKHGSVV